MSEGIDPMTMAKLWFGVSILMGVHLVGVHRNLWAIDGALWWITLALLLVLNGTAIYDHYLRDVKA